jgi:hypothetical protein
MHGLMSRKWAVLSAGFLFMAYDEIFQVHEQLTNPAEASWETELVSFISPGLFPLLRL